MDGGGIKGSFRTGSCRFTSGSEEKDPTTDIQIPGMFHHTFARL